jgi:DNA-binding response OmpR family regulator
MKKIDNVKCPSLLIVEDDADIRDLMKIFLEAEGYQVSLAADGLDALEQLQAGARPSLILLDLMMPRMDGEQFLSEMQSRRFSQTPVVIMAGHCAVQQRADQLKAVCCLTKPVELDELLSTVRQLVPVHVKRDVA